MLPAAIAAAAGLLALAGGLPGTLPTALAQDSGDAMMGGDSMQMGGKTSRVQPDAIYFRDSVLPILNQHCIGCHEAGDPDNETKHQLLPPGEDGRTFTPERVQKNYVGLQPLLSAERPERSRLLLKLLPNSRGGIEHDGGKADGDYFPHELIDPKGPLIQWVFGATPSDAVPIAVAGPVARSVTVGDEVRLDASLSHDPDGADVRVKWEVLEKPLGASAKIDDVHAKRTVLAPDRDGPWTLLLHVHDGKHSGMPQLVRFDAARKTGNALGDAPAPNADYAVSTQERRLTRALYLDLYGRTPTEDEIRRAAAIPYPKRIEAMLADPQMWENWFKEESFYFLLIDRFRPVSDRLSKVPQNMAERRMTFRDAHTEFALSAEFNARNPGNDTYVTVVLEQFLGMEVQKAPRVLKAAKKMYDGTPARIFKTKGSKQSDVISISLRQEDYVDLFLRRMEVRYLGEPLPDGEHVPYRDELLLAPNRFPDILAEWLNSERYTSPDRAPKLKTDHQFIRSLYVDLLGRVPGREEFRNMRNALQALADPAPLRGVLAKVMLGSGAVLPPGAEGDPTTKQVQAIFRRLLGREPGKAELDAFVSVLSEPGTSWKTAALAILNSAHYQYY